MEPCKMNPATTAVVNALVASWNDRIQTIQKAIENGDYFDVLMLIEDLSNSANDAMDVLGRVQSIRSL